MYNQFVYIISFDVYNYPRNIIYIYTMLVTSIQEINSYVTCIVYTKNT